MTVAPNGASSYTISYTTVSGTVTGYQLQRRNAATTTSGEFGTTVVRTSVGAFVIDPTAIAGTTYYYRIRAINTLSNLGPWSDEVSTDSDNFPTVPAGVPTLTNFAAAATGLEVALSWDVEDRGSDITAYTLTRTLSGGTAVTITAPSTTATTLTDTVPAGGDYTYSLTATNANGDNTPATAMATAIAPLEQVTGVTVATNGATSYTISYTTVSGPGTGNQRYQLQRRNAATTTTGEFDTAVVRTSTAAFVIDPTAIAGTTYYYRIRAINNLVSPPGPWSDEVSTDSDNFPTIPATTPNTAPVVTSGDDQTVNEGDTVTLTSMGTDADGDMLTYSWNQFGTPAVSLIGGDEDAVRTFIAPDVSSETILTFVVTANDGVVNSNEGSMVNITVNPVSAPTDPPTADAPVTNFRATLMGDMVSLTWAVRADTTFSTLELSRNDVIISQSLSATDTTDTGVAPGIYVYSLTYTTVPVGGADAETGTLTARITATAPSVSITTRQNAQVDSVITLSATVNDPDGRLNDATLTYAWTVTGDTNLMVDDMPFTPAGIVDADTLNTTYDTANIPSGTVLSFTLSVMGTGIDDNDDISITIGSGASEAQVAAVVSGVARAIVASTISAVANRISTIASGGGVNVGGVNLNDSNMASVVQTNTQAFTTNSDAMKTLLGNSDFQLPLNAKGGGFDSVAVWASGEYSDVSGESKGIDWDGDLTGFHVGIDGKINTSSADNMLVGIAVSALKGDLDYTDETTADKGNYDISMTTISPYIGWRVGGIDLWASVGVGEGEIERTADDSNISNTSDAEQTAFAIGGSGVFHAQDSYYLRIKGELSVADLDIDDSDDGGNNPAIAAQNLKATHVKVAMEATQTNDLERGGAFDKSVEIGARVDGGDGMTGAGVEIGGKLKYAHSIVGFTAEGSARFLLGRDGDYEEWGIQGTIRKQVGRDGQGLSFHLTPAYGDINSGVQQLLAQELNDAADNTADADYEMHMTTRLGYGIAYRGMLTPYTEMVFGTTDQYRMGINWKPSRAFNLTLLSEQTNQNTIRLQGTINL